MISVALRPCLDCRRPANGTRCPACTSTKNKARGSATQRGYDTAWQRLVHQVVLPRDRYICYLCGKPGANSGDHVTPLSQGGARLDPANVRATHSSCNSAKGNR